MGRITRQKICQRFAPETGRGFLQFRVEVFQDRLHGAHDERQTDEGQRHENAELRVGDLDAERFQPLADPAVLAYSEASVMPATAVGSANGRSTSASTIFLPKNS